jgi:phosphoglycerate dehydrogenase-like enzyme
MISDTLCPPGMKEAKVVTPQEETEKPIVALALSRAVHDMMFTPQDLERLSEAAEVVGPAESGSPEHIAPLLADAVVAITGWGTCPIDREMLAKAPRLQLVAHSAGSVKPIVTEALYDRGIRVTTAAAANAAPVAETTVAMMVIMLKRIPWLFSAGGNKSILKTIGPVRELRDLRVGLISASRVGREVIRLLKGYPRLRVLVYDPHLSADGAADLGVERASLEDVCRCDVVSVHAPNIPQTRHMLCARTLALLPDHAILINTSRGSLIDETALVAEVRRRPLYVYLDVTDPEPTAPDSALLREPNILLTPHIAGGMNQARRDMGRMAIDETLFFLRGQSLEHEVTRAMLPTQA